MGDSDSSHVRNTHQTLPILAVLSANP